MYHLDFILKVLVSLVLWIYYALLTVVKQFVPYTYRCKSIKGETVLITGAGSGLGKSLSKKVAKQGARLVLVDIDTRANEKTADEIREMGGVAFTFTCDLSKREDIYKVANEIKEKVGDVTFLVNNAGIVTGKKFLESPDNSIEKTFQVNTMSHFWTAKAFMPSMIEKNHGHLVTIASMAGKFGTAGLCDYCASKFAVVGFNESMRNELTRLGKTGVHTTVVCPFYINTGMFDGAQSSIIPILDQEYVTDKILEAILTNQQELFLPKFMYLMDALKPIMPIEVQDFIGNKAFKTNSSMDNFVGRNKKE